MMMLDACERTKEKLDRFDYHQKLLPSCFGIIEGISLESRLQIIENVKDARLIKRLFVKKTAFYCAALL